MEVKTSTLGQRGHLVPLAFSSLALIAAGICLLMDLFPEKRWATEVDLAFCIIGSNSWLLSPKTIPQASSIVRRACREEVLLINSTTYQKDRGSTVFHLGSASFLALGAILVFLVL